MSSRILIVDDDAAERRLLEEAVRGLGHRVETAESGEAALAALGAPNARPYDAVILDLVMPDLDGMGVLERVGAHAPPIIVQTAGSGGDAASALRAGAFDFLVRPASPERLRVSLANALRLGALEGEIKRMKRGPWAGALAPRDIVARSPAMARVLELCERAARSAIPVLLEGEPGVGKELIARAIQGSGARRAKPFVRLHCGAIPDGLADSVLFGHEKGAVAGAEEKRAGAFREAHGGTLFLDEVGELPPDAQAKVLRALAESEVRPAGAARPARVDVRLIAATDRRLLDLVAEGRFREDLHYRLNVLPIWVPPLRERSDDIPELARRFLVRFAAEEGRPHLGNFSQDALDLLLAHSWPGNVRQLESAVLRAVVFCEGAELGADDFPQVAAQVDARSMKRRVLRPPEACVAPKRQEGDKVVAFPVRAADLPPSSLYGHAHLLDGHGELRRLEALEEEMIRFALDHCRGRMSEAARRLGIGRSTLYRKLKDYGIEAGNEAA